MAQKPNWFLIKSIHLTEKQFKEQEVAPLSVLPSINEYPRGKSGSGDIDSGPVIFEVGFAGTIVSIGTFSVLGDQALAEQKYKIINVFGLSYKTPDTKKYLFGQLLIADAFIAWIRSSGLNYIENSNQSSTYWRFKFHLLSLFTIAILWLLF